MEWMYYLLEANLYLLLFYGFYKLFLQYETFYNSNRYFLLMSSLTAFVLPVLQLGFLKPAPIVNDTLFPPPVLYTVDELASMTLNPTVEPTHYTDYLYPIYLLVAFAFATKLIFSLIKIISLWARADKKSTGKITIIELNAQKTAFSFFNLLFIHPHLAEKETVFRHELVHIKQKHSLDILFFELLQIICWFNPIVYFIKKDIKLLHEYIADDLSTNQGMQKHEYAMFLIENSFGVMPTPLTNQIFNQSILKRRINMLNKKRTANWARLRLLLALPLTGGMLCISTMAFTKSYGYVDLLPESISFQNSDQKAIDEEEMAKKGWYSPSYVFDKNNQYKSLEKRLIVINDVAIKDNNKFYGISNAAKILFLKAKDATNKYGVKGKFGAVEIFGKATVLTYREPYVIADTAKFPAPIPQINKIKSPPPVPERGKVKLPPPPAQPSKGSKSDEAIVVQGYPINTNGEQIKEVKIQAYPQKATPTKVVQGYPINGSKGELKEVKVIGFEAKSDQNLTGKLAEFKANNNEVKPVEVQGYPKKSNLTGVVKGYAIKRDNDDFTGNTIKVSNVVDRKRGNKLIITTANNARKSISIYDRWGNLVFTDKNYNNDWDGNFSNVDDQSKVLEKGTYYYIASTIGNNTKGDLVKGYLTIQ